MPIDIEKVKTIVMTNLPQIRSVKELASRMDVSVETLRKEFRRKECEPIVEFLSRMRLKEMKRLLLKTDLHCYEICSRLGLREDSGHKFFRRGTGLAMEEFRTKQRTGIEKKRAAARNGRTLHRH